MLADHQVIADLVPVDLPVNMMIAVAWARANATRLPDVSCATANSAAIYHITTGGLNPFTWGEMENIVISCFKSNPLESCFRRPKCNILTSNRLERPGSLLYIHMSNVVHMRDGNAKYSFMMTLFVFVHCLQCFHTVGWV